MKIREQRSIILSTQHIEEADVLSNRICVMSHGKIIALDTPSNIKRRFGVGYNVLLEPINPAALSSEQLRELANQAREAALSSGINGIKESKDSINKKLILLVPYSEVDKISGLIRHFEQKFPQLFIDVEMNSLEDAYIKMVEEEDEKRVTRAESTSTSQSTEQSSARAEFESRLQTYMETVPRTTFCTQFSAMVIRRFTVFAREPRQWFMLIAPFVNVVTYIILLSTLVIASVGQQTDQLKTIIRDLIGYCFPFFLLLGFCTSSGIYMIISLLDKESKMRQYMFLSGMGALSYYLGLYAADFLLFLVTMLVFGGSVFIFNLNIYTSQIFEFGLLMLSFGAVLIPFTYLFQHWFKNSDSAFRFVGLVYVLLGILVPTLLVIVVALATLLSP